MTENQLLAEAAALPDMDEFAGMSIRDIALSISLWPEGSEDQLRAIEAIRSRAPGIGHNRPPLSEALDEELAPFAARADELLGTAREAVIADDESAAKVSDLITMLRTLERDIETAREKRGRPYIDAQRLINARFGGIAQPLVLAWKGEDGRGGLRAILTAWEDKRDREAEAERQRLRAQAEQREREAAAARAAAEEAKAKGSSGVAAELTALHAEEEADRLGRRAEVLRPEPIRSHLGQVNRRRDIKFDIADLRALLGWMIKQPGLRNKVEQTVRTIMGAHLRGLGVEAVERGVIIPGATVSVEKGQANVRR